MLVWCQKINYHAYGCPNIIKNNNISKSWLNLNSNINIFNFVAEKANRKDENVDKWLDPLKIIKRICYLININNLMEQKIY